MTPEENRKKVISGITELLNTNQFSFEIVVKKKPKGLKVIYETTQEELNSWIAEAKE